MAKNLFLTNARTVRRKVQELLLTLWLEEAFTKREILEIWLNRVYLGSGAWGMDAAAHLYFGVSARKVTLWQAAVLAGLPRAPSRYNPRVDPAAAAQRAKEVLQAMAETGVITPAQAEAAAKQIAFPPTPSVAGYFADWVAEQAEAQLPPGHRRVLRTTLDARLQSVVEARLAALLGGPGAAAGREPGCRGGAGCGQRRGARHGGRRTTPSARITRAVLARRQPGSAFKPFVWAAALEAGMRPDDAVLDAPIRHGQLVAGQFRPPVPGEMTMEDGLAQSINTVSVRLLLKCGGPGVVAEMAHRLGISDSPAEQRHAGAGHRRGQPAGDGRRLRELFQRRLSGDAKRHRGDHRRRPHRGRRGRRDARAATRTSRR